MHGFINSQGAVTLKYADQPYGVGVTAKTFEHTGTILEAIKALGKSLFANN